MKGRLFAIAQNFVVLLINLTLWWIQKTWLVLVCQSKSAPCHHF
jgi:hypothetical protein